MFIFFACLVLSLYYASSVAVTSQKCRQTAVLAVKTTGKSVWPENKHTWLVGYSRPPESLPFSLPSCLRSTSGALPAFAGSALFCVSDWFTSSMLRLFNLRRPFMIHDGLRRLRSRHIYEASQSHTSRDTKSFCTVSLF